MYIEESFHTIFNMGYWGRGAYNTTSPMDYGSGKSAMDERVKRHTGYLRPEVRFSRQIFDHNLAEYQIKYLANFKFGSVEN